MGNYILGAHPDDIEIFIYGLVCIYKNRGNQVVTMVATDGAKGGFQQDDLLIKQRAEETTVGLKDLSAPIFLNIPDSELGEDPVHQKIIKENILNIMKKTS
jgi:LmbE family N-acetylglucosaminyl deacetylase